MIRPDPRRGVQVGLWYLPPARAPRRLWLVQLTWDADGPTETEIVKWLGPPQSIGEHGNDRALIYSNGFVWFSKDHRTKGLRLSGQETTTGKGKTP